MSLVDSDPEVGSQHAVQFAVQRSWNGVVRDTVTVTSALAGDCGAVFQPGLTYLVAGDVDGGEVSTGLCDTARDLRHALTAEVISGLGEPRWQAAEIGERSFDASIVLVGDEKPPWHA